MKKLIIFLSTFLFAFELNIPYHIGTITDIIHDKNNFYIPGRDGMLKIYNKNFKNIYTFYEYGSINSVAINNKYIVYSGSLGRFFNGIKIYNKKTKKLIKVFNIGRVVSKIRFYKNKFYATTTDGVIYIIDKNLNLSKIYFGNSNYSKSLYGIDFYKNYLYFVNWAGEVVQYNLITKKIENKIKLNQRLQSISINKNKIVVCGNGYDIYLLSPSLNLLKTITTDEKIMSCKLYNDYLIATPILGDTIFYKNFKEYKKIKHIDLSLGIDIKNNDVIFSDGKNLIITGLDNDAIKYINSDILSISDLKNAYPNIKLVTNGGNFGFNLDNLSYSYAFIPKIDVKPSIKYKVITRKLNDDTLVINNKCYIQRDASNGYRHREVKIYKNYIISSGDWGVIDIYNNRCAKVASLYGDITSIKGFDVKNDKLVSFSTKSQINVYDLSTIQDKLPKLRLLFFKNNNFVAYKDNFYYSNNFTVNDLILNKYKLLHTKTEEIKLNYKPIKKINFDIEFIKKCGKYILLSDISNNLAIFDTQKKSIVANKFLSIHSIKCDNKAIYVGGYDKLTKIYLDDFSKYSIKSQNIYKMALGKRLFVLNKNNVLNIYDKNLNKLNTFKYKKRFKITPLKDYKIGVWLDNKKEFVLAEILKNKAFIIGKQNLEAMSDKYYLVGNIVKDKNLNIIYKIKDNFIQKAMFLGDNLYYINYGVLVKINLKTKQTKTINISSTTDMDLKDNKIYISSKYKIFIYDKNLKLLKKYNLKSEEYQNLIRNKQYIAFMKGDEVVLLKNLKIVKKFKYKYLTKLFMNDKYILYGSDEELNLYSFKKKKIINHIKFKDWIYKSVLVGDNLYFILSNSLYKINLKTLKKDKLLKLPQYIDIKNIGKELVFEKDYAYYKLKNNKLTLFISDADGYYKKGKKSIFCNVDKFLVKLNNSKITRKFDSLRLTPLTITKNYFVLSRDGELYIWDMKFNKKILKFSTFEYIVDAVALKNDKILILTNYNNLIMIDLKNNKMKYLNFDIINKKKRKK